MSYSTFKKIANIELSLLSLLGMLKTESRIIQLDNYPDFDLSGYEGFVEKPYFFRDSWGFSDAYAAIISASIEHVGVFHFDDVRRLASEYKVPFRKNESFDVVLNRIRAINSDLMWEEATDPDFNGFKISEIKIERIDQFGKEVQFFGGYSGASDSIQPMDWNILVECSFNALVSGARFGGFYADLIAESYALRYVRNHKLAFFIVFSALENYINERLDSHEREGRLKDKLSELFRNKFGCLQRHQIYTSIVGEYDSWESIRHGIAHGKVSQSVTRDMVGGLTVFILTLLASIEESEESFKGLRLKLPRILSKVGDER